MDNGCIYRYTDCSGSCGDDCDGCQYYESAPVDIHEWRSSRYAHRCESCGKLTHRYFYSEHFFPTMDGYDSMAYVECWRCILAGKILRQVHRLRRIARAVCMFFQLPSRKHILRCWRLCWKCAK